MRLLQANFDTTSNRNSYLRTTIVAKSFEIKRTLSTLKPLQYSQVPLQRKPYSKPGAPARSAAVRRLTRLAVRWQHLLQTRPVC